MKFKKILAGLLASALTFSAGALPSFTQTLQTELTVSAEEYGDLIYEIYDDHVRIIGCDESAVSVDIPSEIDGLPVTTIEYNAFSNCDNLTNITIPNSITSISEEAFSGTALLENQTGVKYADTWVVDCDKDVTSVEIKEGTKGIGNKAFESCEKLESITIPNSITSIGYSAFYECSSLTSVTIPESVTSIGYDTFSSCMSLENIIVSKENSNYSSENGVFFNKDKTELIQYPIGNSKTEYTIPDSVITIGYSAFSGCNNLSSVIIPNSVTTIGSGAFSACKNLSSVKIPDSVNEIGEYAFLGTALLENQADVKYADTWVVDCDKDVTSVEIKEGTKGIGNNVFERCEKLESITIPNSVTSIGNWAFVYCEKLESINIPDSVTSIGGFAFGWCENLVEANIPDGILSINDGLFTGCTNLSEITIPDSVISIGNQAFLECSNLKNITLPNNIENIGDFAFGSCEKLESITIPNSVKRIGRFAFEDCTKLENVIIINPNLEIDFYSTLFSNGRNDNEDGSYTTYFYGTIYGYENSTAQAYAEEYGYKFESLGEYKESEWNVADVVKLQRYLVKLDSEISSKYDLNADEKINVFDDVILKRKVIYG